MIVFCHFLACSPIADQSARKIYNQAVQQLAHKIWMLQGNILEARDQAGTDAVLRQQAAAIWRWCAARRPRKRARIHKLP